MKAVVKDKKRTRYVALLRGINVGGNKIVGMAQLKKAFESIGYENVKTVLASGNVLFDTEEIRRAVLGKQIEEKLKAVFGHEIYVILRTIDEIQRLSDTDPFKKIEINPQTRLYISFLSEKPKGNLKIPYQSPEKDFAILRVSSGEVTSYMTVSPDRNSADLMRVLEKEFGKKITTRNWNTLARILKG